MKKAVNIKRMVTIFMSVLMVAAMMFSISAEALSFHAVTYFAGDVDGIVGATEYTFSRCADTTFDVADSSRFARKGYTLKSWYVPSTGQTVSTGSQYVMPNNDITFVANWEPAVYNVSFTGKGGKTAAGNINVYAKATFGTEMILPENEFIYSGYTFLGWKYDGVIYNAGDSFEVPAIATGKKIVFAAVWGTETAPVTTEAITEATTTEITTEATTTEVTTEATTTEITTEATTTEITTEATTTEITTEATTTEITTEATTTEVTTEATTTEITTEATTTEVTTEATTIEVTTEPEISVHNDENVIGDYNNDGIVDRNDVEALKKYMVGITVEGFVISAETADVNGDGVVNVFDYVALSRTLG